MNKLVIGNISKYYQSVIARLHNQTVDQTIFTQHGLNKDLITGFGTVVYNVNQRGFFGIIDEKGNRYFPANCRQFSRLFRDRKQIQFCLYLHPQVSNIYRWGKTVNVVAIQILD